MIGATNAKAEEKERIAAELKKVAKMKKDYSAESKHEKKPEGLNVEVKTPNSR